MVGAQNVYESTHRAISAIQTINHALHKGFAVREFSALGSPTFPSQEGFFNDAEEEHVVEATLSAEEKISYPQADTWNITYARIGGSLLANLTYWFPR